MEACSDRIITGIRDRLQVPRLRKAEIDGATTVHHFSLQFPTHIKFETKKVCNKNSNLNMRSSETIFITL